MYEEMPQRKEGVGEHAGAAGAGGADTVAAGRGVPRGCGGCGAKGGATMLWRGMKRLEPIPTNPNAEVGIDQPDDAAVVSVPDGMVGVQTVDYFRALVDAPPIFGQIATVHPPRDCCAVVPTRTPRLQSRRCRTDWNRKWRRRCIK